MKPKTLDNFIACVLAIMPIFILIAILLIIFKPDGFNDVIGCGAIIIILLWVIGSPLYFLFIRETKWYKNN